MLVEALNNNNNISSLNGKKATNNGSIFVLRTKAERDSFNKTNSQNPAHDGKFSAWESAKNFFKGLVSPITGMFSSTKNFLISAAAIVGTAGLCAIGLAPAVIAFWTAYGLIEGGKSLHTIITNRNPDEKEKAFFDLGEATFCVGTSVLCAKSALKDFGVDASKMSATQATVECFKNTPKSFYNAFGKIKSFASPTHFFHSTVKQLDASSITDAYGQVLPVARGMRVPKSGMGLNVNKNQNIDE